MERADAHDARDDMIRREAVEEHLGTRASLLEERKLAAYERMLGIAEAAADKEAEILASPLYTETTRVEDDGTTFITKTPAGWNFTTPPTGCT